VVVWQPETDARAADLAHRDVADLLRLLQSTDLLGALSESRGHAPAGAPRASLTRSMRDLMVVTLGELEAAVAVVRQAYSAASQGGTHRNPSDELTLGSPAAVQAAWTDASQALLRATQIHARGSDAEV